jgi:CubicO group peptidase (beta-lactamase class C family)
MEFPRAARATFGGRAGSFLVVATIIAIGYALINSELFLRRYLSFVFKGYDPLTAPVTWYEPVQQLAHGSGATLPVAGAAARTIPDGLIDEVLAYAKAQGSLALIIARGGQIEVEAYWQGATRDTSFNAQSMSKTVLGMLTGFAIADGNLGIDDPVGRFLPEWADDPRGRITVRNLLQMSGGLAQIATDYRPVPWSRGTWQHFGNDFNAPILELELADPPGTRFDYNNNENNLLGLVLERATGRRYPEYLAEKLWVPLDLGPAAMYLDRPGGSVMKSCCILSRPIDWLKLGLLLRDDGRFAGRQVLPPGWAAAMATPAATNRNYGYQLWLAPSGLGQVSARPPADPRQWWLSEPYADPRTRAFLGFGFQHVWILPSIDTVVVRATRQWPTEPWDQSRIPNLLVRGLAAPVGTE